MYKKQKYQLRSKGSFNDNQMDITQAIGLQGRSYRYSQIFGS
jgi:hypothetical protein